MKVRVKFSKTGALKYIGHLDVMRYFQKLNRRADIPVAYSEGFSPHQILSFSPPLPLGAQSMAEYADMQLTGSISSKDAIKALNEATVPGIAIHSFKELPEKSENAMAAVTAARYNCYVKNQNDYSIDCADELKSLLSNETIPVLKKTKKNESIVDIKPFIYEFKITGDENNSVEFLLSAGSVNNLKPELIYMSIFEKHGITPPDHFLNLTRMELYTGSQDALVSLDDVGSDIE